MRLLIASDLHGSMTMTAKFLEKARDLEDGIIVLLGDLLYHGPRNPLPDSYNPPEVIRLLTGLNVPVAAVKGNCDAEVDQLVLPFHLAESSWLTGEARPVLMIHGHQLAINGGPLPAPKNADLLSGHTHVPTAEVRDGRHYWNPGSPSLPKNDFPPSFGILEQSRFRVLSFDGRELMSDSL